MKVSVAQIKITRNKRENIDRALNYVSKAVNGESKLIVLPEVFNTGFFPENYKSVGSREEELEQLLDFSSRKECIIVAGIAERAYNRLYSSASIIYDGEIIGNYRKRHIFPLTDEIKYFSPGNAPGIFETPVGKVGLMICYEIRFPEIARELTYSGASILVIPAQFPSERIEHWRILLKARAIENQIFVVGANCSDYGSSMIVDPWGKVLAEAKEEETLLTADVDFRRMEEIRGKYPFLRFGSNP